MNLHREAAAYKNMLIYGMVTGMKARRGAYTVYHLAYHFVWIPRYRRAILIGSLAARLEELIGKICDEREWQIEALTIQPDHVICLCVARHMMLLPL